MAGKWKLIVDKVSELVKLRDPQESIDDLLLEKLHQLLHIFMNIWVLLVDQLNQILPPERRLLIDDFEGRKFEQLFHILDNMWALLVENFNEVLPPEKISEEITSNFLSEKLHQLFQFFLSTWVLLVDKLNQILPSERRLVIDDFEGRKFDQLFHILENMWALLVEKFNQVLPPEKRSLEMIENFLWEKHVQHFNILKSRWELLVERSNIALPSETRTEIMREWVRVGLTVLVVVLLCVYCCRSKKPRHDAGKMMKAPGGKGAIMARDSFEDNPKYYFRNLHAQKKKKK